MSTIDFAQLRRLSVEERLQLVQDLWDSIAEDTPDLPLTDEQQLEIDRRIADHERDPSKAIPWDEAWEQLKARFG